jgi:exodeoxyribonuclease V alpha subunit
MERLEDVLVFDENFDKKIFSLSTQLMFSGKKLSLRCILGFLCEMIKLGHNCVYVDENTIHPDPQILLQSKNINFSENFLFELKQKIKEGFFSLTAEDKVQEVDRQTVDIQMPFCLFQKKYLYTQKSFTLENLSHFHFIRLSKNPSSYSFLKESFLSDLEKLEKDSALLTDQAQAIKMFYSYNFSMICGGPGSGKTYTIQKLIDLVLKNWDEKQKQFLKVVLAAPTGKASQKLKNFASGSRLPFIDIEAKTIHSLLGINKTFSHKKNHYLDADIIIVDEASMIDQEQMALLLQRISLDTKVVLVGDPHQLPPVESTGFFSEMIELQERTTFLPKQMRFLNQAMEGLTKVLLSGSWDDFKKVLSKEENLFWIQLNEKGGWNAIVPFLQKFSYKTYDQAFKQIEDFSILSCLKHGFFGSDHINHKIQEYFSNEAPEVYKPIMILKNEPDLNLYNGMMGIYHSLSNQAYFKEVNKPIPLFLLPEYEYGYALTVHKSQGSEFQRVLLIIPPGSEVFGKEILYTAATRAKEKLYILADEKTLRALFENVQTKMTGFNL